jgi:hypothetical protein
MCLLAVKQNGRALEFVPAELINVAICRQAIKQNGQAIEFVPSVLRTTDICMKAVQNVPSDDDYTESALSYLSKKEQTPEICCAAVTADPKAKKFVKINMQQVSVQNKTTETDTTSLTDSDLLNRLNKLECRFTELHKMYVELQQKSVKKLTNYRFTKILIKKIYDELTEYEQIDPTPLLNQNTIDIPMEIWRHIVGCCTDKTLLMKHAVDQTNVELLGLLLNTTDTDKATTINLLHRICDVESLTDDSLNMVALLLERDIDLNDVNSANDGVTLLHKAVINNDANLVTLLLGFGADPDIRDADNRRPVYYAIKGNNMEIADMLT